MPLTDIQVRNARPGTKSIRLKDERGLYLEVAPSGGKWWRLDDALERPWGESDSFAPRQPTLGPQPAPSWP